MCAHAINAPSTPRLVEVYLQGVYSRISSPQSTCDVSHALRRCLCDSGESGRVGAGVHPERKASGVAGGTMVAMDTTTGRGAPACRVAALSGEVALRPAGRGAAYCLLKHTNAEELRKKKVLQLRPWNRPSSFTPSERKPLCRTETHQLHLVLS